MPTAVSLFVTELRLLDRGGAAFLACLYCIAAGSKYAGWDTSGSISDAELSRLDRRRTGGGGASANFFVCLRCTAAGSKYACCDTTSSMSLSDAELSLFDRRRTGGGGASATLFLAFPFASIFPLVEDAADETFS